jgi:hypothetical protein
MSCPICESAFKVYGFALKPGLKCYTASEKACCPKKVTVVSFTSREVKFTTQDGVEHSKPFMDFMKSSWLDRSPL